MKFVAIPPQYTQLDNGQAAARRLPFYLAMEEWIAKCLPEDDYFFIRRVAPTVICGRNQDIDAETDRSYCEQNHIDVVRRKSGGGCVYADMGNFMFSCIVPTRDVESTFTNYTSMIAATLRKLNIAAMPSGRNDILINGKKVSGNAFYLITPNVGIAHGTMLYDISGSSEHFSKAITPSRAKLESKRVQSVQSRITSLKSEGLTLSDVEFEQFVISDLTDSRIVLTSDDIKSIEAIEQSYYTPEFIQGDSSLKKNVIDTNSSNVVIRKKQIDGVGEFNIRLGLSNENNGCIIQDIFLTGDYFSSSCDNISARLLCPLKGLPYSKKHLQKAIDIIPVQEIISGLSRKDFLELLIE